MFKEIISSALLLLGFSSAQQPDSDFEDDFETEEEFDRPPETDEELRQLEEKIAKDMIKHQQKLRARQPLYVTLADQISLEHVELFTKYIDGNLFGFGGGFFERVNNIDLSFTAKMSAPVDIKKARQLLIQGSQDLLYRINQSEEIRPFLKNYPFDGSNLGYSILFMDKEGEVYVTKKGEESQNRLTSCLIAEGKISYWIDYSSADPGPRIFRETYEEALEIVKRERPDLLKPLTNGVKIEM